MASVVNRHPASADPKTVLSPSARTSSGLRPLPYFVVARSNFSRGISGRRYQPFFGSCGATSESSLFHSSLPRGVGAMERLRPAPRASFVLKIGAFCMKYATSSSISFQPGLSHSHEIGPSDRMKPVLDGHDPLMANEVLAFLLSQPNQHSCERTLPDHEVETSIIRDAVYSVCILKENVKCVHRSFWGQSRVMSYANGLHNALLTGQWRAAQGVVGTVPRHGGGECPSTGKREASSAV